MPDISHLTQTLTQSTTGSLTNNDIGVFNQAQSTTGLAVQQQIRQAASTDSATKFVTEAAEDPLQAGLVRSLRQADKLQKPPAIKTRLNKNQSKSAFDAKADEYEQRTRGDIKATLLRLVRDLFKNKHNQKALKMLQNAYNEPLQANLIDETLAILEEEEEDSAVKESINTTRTTFNKEHAPDIDRGKMMTKVARDIATARGTKASEVYTEVFYIADENVSAQEASSKVFEKHATAKEIRSHVKQILTTLGATTKDSNIDRPFLIFINRAGRKTIAIYGVLNSSEASIQRIRKEAAHLAQAAWLETT